MENNEKQDTDFAFDVNIENLIISKEDLKFKDNTQTISVPRKTINRNYDFLFSEEKSIKIDDLVEKGYRYFVKDKKIKSIVTLLRLRFIEKVKELHLQERNIWQDIHYLTSNQINAQQFQEILEDLKFYPIVNEVKENNGVISIQTTLGEIKFSKISDFFPQLEIDDDIENMDVRLGKCHLKAVEYSKKLRKIGIDNDVVTANKYPITEKSPYLHSWNEFKVNEKDHILDYTQNIVMNKEGFYTLIHVGKIISRINCVDIENDPKYIKQMDNGEYYIDIKTYLTCRDEIMRDLQKNIDIFHDER